MALEGLTEEQRRSIRSVTSNGGVRMRCVCGACGRDTEIAVDGRGRAWWMCADCLARRLDDRTHGATE